MEPTNRIAVLGQVLSATQTIYKPPYPHSKKWSLEFERCKNGFRRPLPFNNLVSLEISWRTLQDPPETRGVSWTHSQQVEHAVFLTCQESLER